MILRRDGHRAPFFNPRRKASGLIQNDTNKNPASLAVYRDCRTRMGRDYSFTVEAGPAAAWFGETGGGLQFETATSINGLITDGDLQDRTGKGSNLSP